MNKIIIFKEKHGDRHFDASTTKKVWAACLKILKERLDDGYWYYVGTPPSADDILTEEQITQLPTENLQVEQSQKRKAYLRAQKSYEREVKFLEDAKQAVETGDGKIAYRLLLNRLDAEYEGF